MTTNKSASGQGYLNRWLTEENIASPALLDAFVARVTAETHPEDHPFVENPDLPGTCSECGWIEPGTETSDCDCGDDLRAHVEAIPDAIVSAMAEAAMAELMLVAMLSGALGGEL